jgi:hypothetical protein
MGDHARVADAADDSVARAEARRRRIYREVGDGPKRVLKPVGWMLSPELVAGLRAIARKRSDPLRWMWLQPGYAHVEDGVAAGAWRPVATGSAPRADLPTPPAPIAEPASGALWFDYVADIGDGNAAMFSTACLLQADLRLTAGGAPPNAAEIVAARQRWADQPSEGIPAALRIELVAPGSTGPAVLPRGDFLFVGGDTAYHIADRVSLVTRVQAPFTWAEQALTAARLYVDRPARIYGIPGNHDWYDELDGFARIFRAGPGPSPSQGAHQAERHLAARTIDLIGFRRRQHASHLAIALPWGWQLWGLDIDRGLNEAQRRYFASHLRDSGAGPQPPARLIVCTPSPPVVMHQRNETPAHQDALTALGLPRIYAGEAPVGEAPARLDLSGDTHHYARYLAPDDDPAQVAAPRPYQAVVSGLGGAFLHGTHTALGTYRPVTGTLFPPPAAARRDVARGTRAMTLFIGGWVRVIPLLLTMLFTWVWLQPGTARALGDEVLWQLGFRSEVHIFGGAPLRDHLSPITGDQARAFGAKAVVLLGAFALLIAAGYLARTIMVRQAEDPRRRRGLLEAEPGQFWSTAFDWARGYWLVTLIAGVGLATLALGPELFPSYQHGLTVDTLAVLGLAAAPVLAAWFTRTHFGGEHLRGARRWTGVLLAFLHVAIQLVTMVVLARIALAAPLWSALIGLGYLAVNELVAPRLASLDCRDGWRAALIIATWLAAVAGLWIGIGWAAEHHLVTPAGAFERAVLMAGSALGAMFLGCAHLGWYFAAMSSLGFHNNEVGGAARVDRYRQFIRFKVEPDRVTGYVIGLCEVVDPRRPTAVTELRPFLVDVFTVAPAAVAAPAAPSLDPVDSPDRDRERDRG